MSEAVDLLIERAARVLFATPGTAEPGGTRPTGTLHSGSSPKSKPAEEPLSGEISIAISGDTIRAIGPANEIAGRFHARKTLDAGGRLVTPGLVDSHTHLVFAGDRSREFEMRCQGADYEEIAAAGGGIRASVRATRAASEDELFDLALPRLERMLASGSTTIEIKSGYGLDLETELRMLRVARRLDESTPAQVVATFMGAHEFPDDFRDRRDEYVDEVCDRMIPAVVEEGLAEFCDVFCERGVFTPEQAKRVLETGKAAGLRPKIHADEMAATGGSEVAASVGAVSADHLMYTPDASIEAMREAGVVATVLPGTTFYLGKPQYAPARRMLDAGLEVALATDRNPGSCTIESLVFLIGLSCLKLGLRPLEAFRAATYAGARALGREDRCGQLAPGLRADCVIWDAPHEGRICYEFENRLPRTVIAGGQVIAGKDLTATEVGVDGRSTTPVSGPAGESQGCPNS